jgi:glycosyltransferase involved in cell wall biosynthesis
MVSVIIPCYNASKTISRALESVANQTYKDFEIVIVDDGSTDKSKDVIDDFMRIYNDLVISYLYQKNSGPSKARNVGVTHAKGEYIAFLDADDEWNAQKLYIQVSIIQDKKLEFLGSTYQYEAFDDNMKNKKSILKKFSFSNLLLKTQFSTPGVIIKKSLFLKFNGFDTDMKYSEDNDLWLRIAVKRDLYLIVEPKLIRLHKKVYGESGLSNNMVGMYLGELYILKKLLKNKSISILKYVFLSLFVTIKLFRRIIKISIGKI